MSAPGWIKIHRALVDHWVWDGEFSQGQAWIDLLMKACHKPNKLNIKGQLIELKRGQQARSEVTLSKEWGWSRGKVRRFLTRLENDSMIVHETTHLTSVISICNYDSFQSVSTEGDTANGTGNGTADGHLTVHKQEVKEFKKERSEEENKKKVAPAVAVDFSQMAMSTDQIDELKRIRAKNKGGAITQRVANALSVEFGLAKAMGYTSDEILTEWELRGWKSLKAEWMTPKHGKNSSQAAPKPREFSQ